MRPEKKAITDEIRDLLAGAEHVILINYQGLSVDLLRRLRGELGPSGVRVQVVRNAYLARAAESAGRRDAARFLDGPTAVLAGSGDMTESARKLAGFRKDRGLPVLKGGWLGGQVLTASEIDEMARIPPRDVLLGRLVGTLAAPMTQLAGVLRQKAASLVYVLKAIEEKKKAG